MCGVGCPRGEGLTRNSAGQAAFPMQPRDASRLRGARRRPRRRGSARGRRRLHALAMTLADRRFAAGRERVEIGFQARTDPSPALGDSGAECLHVLPARGHERRGGRGRRRWGRRRVGPSGRCHPDSEGRRGDAAGVESNRFHAGSPGVGHAAQRAQYFIAETISPLRLPAQRRVVANVGSSTPTARLICINVKGPTRPSGFSPCES
jgi:hypothetical protein